MKSLNSDKVRHVRVRAVVAYPALTVALVVSIALALTPFGPSRVMALDAPTPTESTLATATETPSPTTTDAPTPTTTDPPSPVSTSTPTLTPTPSLSPTPSPIPAPSPSTDAVVAPGGISVDHHVVAQIDGLSLQATYLAVDAPALNASQFQTFRVRFQLGNAGADAITATPRLEYRVDGAADFAVVPESPKASVGFYVAREWVPSLGLAGGTVQGPLGEDIAVADFRMGQVAGDLAISGHHSMGANPDAPVTLPAASYTEQEFTVRVTMAAKYLTGYELRVTNAGTALAGTPTGRIVLGAEPPVQLSPGQQQGVSVDNAATPDAAGATYPLSSAPSTAAATTPETVVAVSTTATGPRFALASGSLSPATTSVASATVAGETTVLVAEGAGVHSQCAACHRGHTAKAADLTKTSQQSTLCFSCHDGSGALGGTGAKDVKNQYDLDRPINNATERDYYSHDAVDTSITTTHSLDPNEFEGVSNRHSECADCHNPHRAASTPDSVETFDTQAPATSTGWGTSGSLAGVSGVSVINGILPNSVPAPADYTLLDGIIKPVTLEYQLCFKCHSGFTTLLPPVLGYASKDALDKAVELNPANPSFHPVEAAGKNGTPAMTASLQKSSPYKLWKFSVDSTIRCLNCHAGGAPDPSPLPTPLPLPGSLAPHASSNRGILLKNYQDRLLKKNGEAYSADNFALCYVCHGEEPFTTDGTSSDATNFSLHSQHLTGLTAKGDGVLEVDKAGAGAGNAICAECHFRIHSTTNKVGTQAVNGTRLVNFAPNVQPDVPGGTLSWTPGVTGSGSCTLTCHGVKHSPSPYSPYVPAVVPPVVP